MRCPTCGASENRVVDSRPADEGRAIRRRRECDDCDGRFTTYERLEPELMVRKRNGRVEAFSSTKLIAGVSAALADRPVSGSQVEALVSGVEQSIRSEGGQVGSEQIGHEVLERLKDLDEVAYLRFASVYKEFEGVADFEKELAELESAE